MSRKDLRNVEDLYSVVDLSKKKKRSAGEADEPHGIDTAVSIYAVLEKETPLDPEFKNYESDTINENVRPRDVHFISCKRQRGLIILGIITAAMLLAAMIVMILMLAILFVKVGALEEKNNSFNEEAIFKAFNTTLQKVIHSERQETETDLDNVKITLQDVVVEEQWASLKNSTDLLADIFRNEIMSLNESLHSLSNDVQRYTSTGLETFGTSCFDIFHNKMGQTSGNYVVKSPSGVLRSIYCDMTRNCSGVTGGWMQVAKLNTTNCPPKFRSMSINNGQSCVATKNGAGCTSIIYSTFNPFSKVCGQIRGYQGGTMDGFHGERRSIDLNENYLDGISVTSNNQHIWSFVAGRCNCSSKTDKPTFVGEYWTCDCSRDSDENLMGNDLTCDTESHRCSVNKFCTPLLWQSQQCNSPPAEWFLKDLDNSTSEIEVRLCRDQPRDDEDLAIKTLELYVQ